MKKTKVLLTIMLLLVIAICATILYKSKDDLKYIFIEIENATKSKQVKIPSTIENNKKDEFITVKPTTNFEPKNFEDLKSIYYTVLNNGWENFTFYCPSEYTTCHEDVLKFDNNNEYISTMNNYVSSYNQFKKYNTVVFNDEIRLSITKLYSKEETMVLKLKIAEIINSLNINKNNVTEKDILSIHDYIINNVTYDPDYENTPNSISNTAYGALYNKKAVCSGYTDLFALFLDELNIPNFKVSSETHIWNAVYFNNKWNHVDTTWDDDEINRYNTKNFFLLSTDELFKLDNDKHDFKKELYLELN